MNPIIYFEEVKEVMLEWEDAERKVSILKVRCDWAHLDDSG